MSDLTRERAFEILRIPEGAGFYAIRHAYRKQLMRWHPKRHGHSSESIQKFIEIREAFKLLVDSAEDEDDADIWRAMVGSNSSIFRVKDDTGTGYFYFMDKDSKAGTGSNTTHVYHTNNRIPKSLEEVNEKPIDPDTLVEMEEKANKAAKELIDEENKAKRKAEKRKRKKMRQKIKKQKEKETRNDSNEDSNSDENISLHSYKDRHKENGVAEGSSKNTSDENFSKHNINFNSSKHPGDVTSSVQASSSRKQTLSKPRTKMKNGNFSKRVGSDRSTPDEVKSDDPEWDETSAFFTKVANSTKLKVKSAKKTNGSSKPENGELEIPLHIVESRNLASVGNKKASENDFAGAASCYTGAISLHNLERRYFSNRSFCYEKLGQYERALDDANTAISLSSDWDKGYFRKGKALFKLGRYTESETAFEQAFKLDQSNKEVENELHSCRLSQLLLMGFPKDRCEVALKKTGDVQLALDELLSGVLAKSSLQDVYVSDEEDAAFFEEETKSSAKHYEDDNDDDPDDTYNEVEYNSLWVGNITPSITEEQMKEYFSQFGAVSGINMLYPSRCAFVNYYDPESAKLALLARDTIEVVDTTLIIRYPERAFHDSKPTHSARVEPAPARSVSNGGRAGKECHYWRNSGCHFGPRCRFVHIPANEGIELKEQMSGRW